MQIFLVFFLVNNKITDVKEGDIDKFNSLQSIFLSKFFYYHNRVESTDYIKQRSAQKTFRKEQN